ncbi:MAG TPA: hypothetical protein ENF74_05915 [Firmicutes bacterium]|nr:hypothetical protein [Bacillota bacterium]
MEVNMTERDVQKLLQELDQVRSQVLMFEAHLPEILEEAKARTKAHLLAFEESFPKLRHAVEFVGQVVPTINRMIRMWPEKAGSIPQATSNLHKVTEATETATTEIMDVVDGIMAHIGDLKARLQDVLEGIRKGGQKSCDRTLEEVVQDLDSVNDSLFQILSALQFQDITAQQIEATKAILAELNQELKALFKGFTRMEIGEEVEVRHGTFDRQANYDRKEAKVRQGMIDRVFEGGSTGEIVSQDDIDAIFD